MDVVIAVIGGIHPQHGGHGNLEMAFSLLTTSAHTDTGWRTEMSTPFWEFKQNKDDVLYQCTLSDDTPECASAGPATSLIDPLLGEQAVKDWERNRHVYFINGCSIDDLLGTTPLTSVDQLRHFFRDHLFYRVNDIDKQAHLVDEALRHCHQGGLPHAANIVDYSHAVEEMQATGLVVKQPDFRVDFYPLSDGLLLDECNDYRTVTDLDDQPLTLPVDRPYIARTHSRTSLRSPRPGKTQIKVHAVTVDVADQRVRRVFDRRSILKKVVDFCRSLIKTNHLPDLTSSADTRQYQR